MFQSSILTKFEKEIIAISHLTGFGEEKTKNKGTVDLETKEFEFDNVVVDK